MERTTGAKRHVVFGSFLIGRVLEEETSMFIVMIEPILNFIQDRISRDLMYIPGRYLGR